MRDQLTFLRKDQMLGRSFLYRVRARDDRSRVTIMNPKIAQTSPPHNSTTMGSIEAAIAAIESLEPDKDFCYKKIAAAYSVDRVTLSQRHQEV
jgi:hypothetical protein